MIGDAPQQTGRLIVIVGFMGSGKTTVARELARLLNCHAIDLDELIGEREKRSPGEIIEQSGEDHFRQIEFEALRDVSLEGSTGDTAKVVALGGGAWTFERNRDLINQQKGITVWLDAPFELCWERIQASGGRPLARDDLQAQMLYAERRVQYALAELHFQVDPNQSAAEICRELVKALRIRNS